MVGGGPGTFGEQGSRKHLLQLKLCKEGNYEYTLASRAFAIALMCSPIAIHYCYAARIYNNLGQAVAGGAHMQLPAGIQDLTTRTMF